MGGRGEEGAGGQKAPDVHSALRPASLTSGGQSPLSGLCPLTLLNLVFLLGKVGVIKVMG